MIDAIISDRYQIKSKLGQGGMGIVYRAHDQVLKRDVALKLLSDARLGTEGRGRLLREAQMAANLRHSNIVVVHDAGEHEESPYIVMELLEGQTLYDKKPTDLEEIVAITKQICAALDHAHRQGIIHRDLKPENVIIEPDGTVKLMDFGLARSVASRMTSEGTVMGTVHYMAPEQVTGEELDGRVDLYALGVMLYEFTTGQLPFEAESPVAIITQHLNAPVVPPRAKREDLPLALTNLIIQLLEKRPQDRPPSASALLELLNDPGLLATIAGPEQELYSLDRIVRGRIVGREEELRQIVNLWQQTMIGSGQLVMVSGEPGIGKTRLAREILTQAEVSGGRAFSGECQPEGNTPYSAFAQIVRRVLREHAGNGVQLPQAVLADMLKLSPELKTTFPDVEPNPELDPEAEQRRLFEHMVSLCQIMSSEAPLLLLLEDLHWADSSTLAMMNILARRTIEIPVMLLGTYREVELDVALPFHQSMQDLSRHNLGNRIKLERLDREKTKNMLATIFSEEITPDFLDGIFQETDGNPFFIEEVCKALIESGQLTFRDGRWDRPSMEELTIPQGVKVAIQSRITRLTEESQSVLLFAAVIGRVFDYPTLEMVAGMDEDALIDCLEEGLHAQLIEEIPDTGGEGFSFSHALIPFSLRESVSGLRRSRLHRKVAAAIEKVAPEDYERLAYHWGEGGSDEKGLAYTIKAARRAQRAYANQEAVRLFTDALSLLPEDHPQRYDLLSGRARVYQVIGDYDRQKADAQAMLSIAEAQGNDEWKMDALLELASNSLETDVQQVAEYVNQVISIAEPAADQGRLGMAFFFRGQQFQQTFDTVEAKAHFEKAAPLLKAAGLTKEAAENLSYLSVVLGDLDKEAALKAALEAQDISRTTDDRQLQATAARRVAIAQLNNYRLEEARATSRQALDMFRVIGDRNGELHAVNVHAIVNQYLGHLNKAEKGYMEMLQIAKKIGAEMGQRYGVENLMVLYNHYIGEYEKGLKLAEAEAEKAQHESNPFIHFSHMATAVQVQYYRLGQYQIPLDIMLRYQSDIETYFDLSLQTVIQFYVVELYFHVGDDDHGEEFFLRGQEFLAENEFSPVPEYYCWDNIIAASLLRPSLIPREEIVPVVEGLIQEFRTSQHLQGVANACYSISRLYLALAMEDPEYAEKALAVLIEAEEIEKIIPADDMLIEHQLFLHARAHRLAHHDEQADEYLRRAHERLLACASKIETAEYRQSYLENVPENVAIQQAYRDRFG